MSVKAIQAKVVCTQSRLRDYLWASHRLFNESLAFVIKQLLAMKHGADGPLRERFDKKTAEKFRAVYCDMMGIGFEGLGIKIDELPKDKREGRSQSAHAWMELITDYDSTRDSKSKSINPLVLKLIRELLEDKKILFERNKVFKFGGDANGFRRLLFGLAARRILTNVQNEENHRELLIQEQEKFENWKNADRTRFSEFEKILPQFRAYEDGRTRRAQENVSARVRETVRIDGAMTKGWRDLQQALQGAENNPTEAVSRIKEIQKKAPKEIGDINFFLWLADKPHLWEWVNTVKIFNDFEHSLEMLARPVNFSYPRAERRSEWFNFSEDSPGHMYDFDIRQKKDFGHLVAFLRQEAPLRVRLHVFVPNEDVLQWQEIEKKQKKKLPVENSDLEFLKQPINWKEYEHKPMGIAPELRGFFSDQPSLDLSRFSRQWVTFELQPDRRVQEKVRYAGKVKSIVGRKEKQREEEMHGFEFNWGFDEKNPIWRPVNKFGGAKLIYPKQNSAKPYLYFSFDLEPVRKFDTAFSVKMSEEQPSDSTDSKQKKKKPKPPKLPDGLRTMAIDLGMRHLAIGTVFEVKDGKFGSQKNGGFVEKPLATLFLKLPGLEMFDIQKHEWEKKHLQRETAPRGHLRRGRFAIELTEHMDSMKDDRAKKAAHMIVEAAWKHSVHYLIFENLKGYRPEQELTHDVNRRLRIWNRRQVVEAARQVADCYGIRVYDFAAPSYTSRVCSACGEVGARFSQISSQQQKRDARFYKPKGLVARKYQVISGGQMFACPSCHRIVNADFNASSNLHRRFSKTFDFVERYKADFSKPSKASYEYKGERLEGAKFWEQVASDTQKFLNEKFKQEIAPAGGWPTPRVPVIDENDDVPFEWKPSA